MALTTYTAVIDGHSVEVEQGQTVLHAARKLDIDIPTLCYLEQCGPLNSCLVCLVKINGKLVPACGTKVEPGMVVRAKRTKFTKRGGPPWNCCSAIMLATASRHATGSVRSG
jgi:NADH dehydrogenase/NADH:ubiquinone oxidoreductase subunit G